MDVSLAALSSAVVSFPHKVLLVDATSNLHPWQHSICRKIVVYVVYSLTSRAIPHALWRLLSNDFNDTLLTEMLNAARLS